MLSLNFRDECYVYDFFFFLASVFPPFVNFSGENCGLIAAERVSMPDILERKLWNKTSYIMMFIDLCVWVIIGFHKENKNYLRVG